MGSCSSGSSDYNLAVAHRPLRKQQTKELDLLCDDSHLLMDSYGRHGMEFHKINYDWFSIPITNPIDLSKRQKFQVINRGINNDCFLVGVIKADALRSRTRMPWKTNNVICYESH